MIAVDTNVLVHAHRAESPRHDRALFWLKHLAEGGVPWGLPVFCIGEFVRVVTHRAIFDPPSTVEQATSALAALLKSPSVRILNPADDWFDNFSLMLVSANAAGNLAFDAQIAAVCRAHGVDALLTEDRDFARFPSPRVVTLDTEP